MLLGYCMSAALHLSDLRACSDGAPRAPSRNRCLAGARGAAPTYFSAPGCRATTDLLRTFDVIWWLLLGLTASTQSESQPVFATPCHHHTSLDLRDLSVYRPTTGARSRTSARLFWRLQNRQLRRSSRTVEAPLPSARSLRRASVLLIPTPIPYIPPGGLASAPLPATQRPAPSLWPSSGVGRAFSQRRALS